MVKLLSLESAVNSANIPFRNDEGTTVNVDRKSLSIVLPAYNERNRLPIYLKKIREYCDRNYPRSYEVIVVDDGSCDGMWDWLQEECLEWPELKALRHATNAGKGAAVRTGVAAATSEYLLFADADGATPIDEEAQLRELLAQGSDIAVGSRVGQGAQAERHWFRLFQGWVFRKLVRAMLQLPVNDSQCGFKMITHRAAQELFPRMKECGFLLDLELLMEAHAARYKIGEKNVCWREIEGSKVQPVRDVCRMIRGLCRLRWNRSAQPRLTQVSRVETASPRGLDSRVDERAARP